MMGLLLGCTALPETIAMSGTVWDAPYGEGDIVGGAALDVFDSALEPVDSQTSDSDGHFTVSLPTGVPFYLAVAADAHVVTAFSGTAGISDLVAPDGYPWVAPTSWIDSLKATFAGCPGVEGDGVIVAGEVRAWLSGFAYAEMPLVLTGAARVYAADETEYATCYLDDDGVYSPDATETGATGRFAIFGVSAGEIIVDVRYTDPSGTIPVELFQFLAPEDGVVPLYPALVEVL